MILLFKTIEKFTDSRALRVEWQGLCTLAKDNVNKMNRDRHSTIPKPYENQLPRLQIQVFTPTPSTHVKNSSRPCPISYTGTPLITQKQPWWIIFKKKCGSLFNINAANIFRCQFIPPLKASYTSFSYCTSLAQPVPNLWHILLAVLTSAKELFFG